MGMGSAHSTLWDFHDYDKYPKSMSRANGTDFRRRAKFKISLDFYIMHFYTQKIPQVLK